MCFSLLLAVVLSELHVKDNEGMDMRLAKVLSDLICFDIIETFQ